MAEEETCKCCKEDVNEKCNYEDKSCNCDSSCTCGCQEGKPCTCDEKCKCDEDKNAKKHKKKDKHEDKLNEAYNMISTLEDKLLREKAESANYRKRKEEETQRLLKYSNEDIVKEILPVVDNFERALKMSNDLENDFFKGFKMIYCNLVSILEKFEVKAIDENNKPFDPAYHEAVLTEAKEGIEAGIVLDVMQKGYMLKDKVIRPAMVKVSE